MAALTKGAALYSFLNSIMTAYAESEVPKGAVLPYLTYEFATGAWGDGEIPVTVNMYFYTDSEKEPNAKAQELSEKISMGGVMLSYTGGAIWLKRGSPFCQSMYDETDPQIKRRYINLSAEFISEN